MKQVTDERTGRVYRFPDEATPAQIRAAIARDYEAMRRPEMRSVSREEYRAGATEMPSSVGADVGPGLSPAEKMFGGLMRNVQRSAEMATSGVESLTGMDLPKPQLHDPRHPPRFGVGREPYPTGGFGPQVPLPIVGQTPREFLPEAVSGAAQIAFPPGRGASAVGEVAWNALTGTVGELGTEAAMNAAEGQPVLPEMLQNLPERGGAHLMGAGAAKGLGLVGEQLFGRPATEMGERAVGFAREALERGTEARKVGSPRLPVDAVTGGKFPGMLRTLLLGQHSANTKARQAANWINSALEGQTRFKFVTLPSGAKYPGVPSAVEVKTLAREALKDAGLTGKEVNEFMGAKLPAKGWVNEIANPRHAGRLQLLEKTNPDVHALVLARHLTDTVERFTRPDPIYGRILDGARFHKYVEDNSFNLHRLYGERTWENLRGFAAYARLIDEPVKRAVAAERAPIGAGEVLRFAAETSAFAWPKIALPVQAYAWGMSHALMDPGSIWFQLFKALPKTDKVVQQATRTGIAAATDNDGG